MESDIQDRWTRHLEPDLSRVPKTREAPSGLVKVRTAGTTDGFDARTRTVTSHGEADYPWVKGGILAFCFQNDILAPLQSVGCSHEASLRTYIFALGVLHHVEAR